MKEKRIEWILYVSFIVVGIIAIIIGIIIGMSLSKFKNVAVATTATVYNVDKSTDSDGETNYTIHVSYLVDGEEYDGKYSSSIFVKEGSNVTIYYDKNNPGKIRTTKSILPAIFVCAFGSIFSTIGIALIGIKALKKNKKDRLIQNGVKIDASFHDIIRNNNYNVNGNYPYIIVCQGVYQGEYRTFKSENIWNDPEFAIKGKNITSFPVYINPDDPKEYYLSIDAISEVDKY